MKKNRMMRLASTLLILTLLTTSAVSGTFAKYTTEYTAQDTARVAYWGFDEADTLTIDLFNAGYNGTVASYGGVDNVIAPGSTQTAFFKLISTTGAAPEVDYTITVDTDESDCEDLIKNNKNITWYLDNVKVDSWDDLLTAIEALSGSYEAGTTPDADHSIRWDWAFEGGDATYDHDNDSETAALNQDEYDTYMGNEITTELDAVILKITITATQVD